MSQPAAIAVIRKSQKTGRKGGQKGNGNALKGGVWADISRRSLDGRTSLARELQAAERGLFEAIGGTPTPQQKLLVARVIYKSWRCRLYEVASLNGDDPSPASDVYYLSWANSVRADLLALGIEGVELPSDERMPPIRVELVSANPSEPAGEQPTPAKDSAVEHEKTPQPETPPQYGRPLTEVEVVRRDPEWHPIDSGRLETF